MLCTRAMRLPEPGHPLPLTTHASKEARLNKSLENAGSEDQGQHPGPSHTPGGARSEHTSARALGHAPDRHHWTDASTHSRQRPDPGYACSGHTQLPVPPAGLPPAVPRSQLPPVPVGPPFAPPNSQILEAAAAQTGGSTCWECKEGVYWCRRPRVLQKDASTAARCPATGAEDTRVKWLLKDNIAFAYPTIGPLPYKSTVWPLSKCDAAAARRLSHCHARRWGNAAAAR